MKNEEIRDLPSRFSYFVVVEERLISISTPTNNLSISVMAIFMTYVLKMTPFFQMENHTKAHYFWYGKIHYVYLLQKLIWTTIFQMDILLAVVEYHHLKER